MRFQPLFLAVALMAGCGGKLKRLSATEADHYYALKVWMDDDQKKTFLKYKTEEERNSYLKDQKLWDRFYAYDAATRDEIVAGEVQVGWREDAMFMSWGNPIVRKRLTGRPAARSEMFTYRFEVDTDGIVRVWQPKSSTSYKAVAQYEIDAYVDDSVVAELIQRDKW